MEESVARVLFNLATALPSVEMVTYSSQEL